MPRTIYFAGPLFTLAERLFNQTVVDALTAQLPEDVSIILPQDFDAGEPDGSDRWYREMYEHCIREVARADLIIAILDGADSDSGTCMEVGYAAARGTPIIGVRTDFRECEDRGMNLMLSQACAALVLHKNPAERDITTLANQIADAIKAELA